MIEDKLKMIDELEDNISYLEYDDLLEIDCYFDTEEKEEKEEKELFFKDLIKRARKIKC